MNFLKFFTLYQVSVICGHYGYRLSESLAHFLISNNHHLLFFFLCACTHHTQDNKIDNVTGLEFLGSLKELCLANNPITDFKDLTRLGHLPSLTDLSLKDLNFGVCFSRGFIYLQLILSETIIIISRPAHLLQRRDIDSLC